MANRKKTFKGRSSKLDSAVSKTTPDVSGMINCIDDARQAALDGDRGPAEPNVFTRLRERLENVRAKLPPLYRETFVNPFIAALDALGQKQFDAILHHDPQREDGAVLMMDIAQAILQHGEKYEDTATDGFQEVVSDLYDGFLSAEDRKGVKPPDRGAIPPLVKWGNPDFGPYTWPVDAMESFKLKAGIVNLPPANIRKGLFAWTALGHETAGHDILRADTGLQDELARAIHAKLTPLGHGLNDYWSERIDESASDVMGILNMGPMAGFGLIVYFRALNAAYAGEAKLRNEGPGDDSHPADIVRGYLAAETVALLKFAERGSWSKLITAETQKDVGRIKLAGEQIQPNLARNSAKIVAGTLVGYKAKTLEGHALGEIQNWRDQDEQVVRIARTALAGGAGIPEQSSLRIYAAHVVAATALEALADNVPISQVFGRMKAILKEMHDKNPSWGPLYVRHPGNVVKNLFYIKAPKA